VNVEWQSTRRVEEASQLCFARETKLGHCHLLTRTRFDPSSDNAQLLRFGANNWNADVTGLAEGGWAAVRAAGPSHPGFLDPPGSFVS